MARRLDFLGDIDLSTNVGLAKFTRSMRELVSELHIHAASAADELEARLATRPARDGMSAAGRAKRIAAPLVELADELEGLEKKPKQTDTRFKRLFEQEIEEAKNKRPKQFKIVA